jgi:membrane protein implicated in regulation of membrane protease activity
MDLIEFISLSSWSFWFAVGAILFVIEVLMPTFLALGFGIGAWIVAFLIAFLWPVDWQTAPAVLALWATCSALSWIGLRLVFKNRFSGSDFDDGDINEY